MELNSGSLSEMQFDRALYSFKHNQITERSMYPAHLIPCMYPILKENSNNKNASFIWQSRFNIF